MITVKVDLRAVESIKRAEIKKRHLEDKGWKVVAEDVGLISATLFMDKIKQ